MHVELAALTRPTLENVSSEDFTAYIARIGRVKDNPTKLIRYLINHAHWSPFEHTYMTFKIVTSRAMGRELLRHRSFTFQELSQRYEKILNFEPVMLRQQSEKNRQSSTHECDPLLQLSHHTTPLPASVAVEELFAKTRELYTKLLEAGVARECARFILPETTSTTILMTGSLRSWIHFFAIRDHADAQKEVRDVTQLIKKIFIEQFPSIAEAAFGTEEQMLITPATKAVESTPGA